MKAKIIQTVGKTPIIPITLKILTVFICLLLLSNFTTNYINIRMNQTQIIRLTNAILVKQLKDIYTNAVNQHEIFQFSTDYDGAVHAIITGAEKGFEYPRSIALGVRKGGSLVFQAGGIVTLDQFPDKEALDELNANAEAGIEEGSVHFNGKAGKYLAVYKYSSEWECYFIRAELVKDMNADSNRVFLIIALFIIAITLMFMVLGLLMLSQILRFIHKITESLYNMQQKQELDRIDLTGASNDDITYLGLSFNTLSSTINNLLSIFRKFVSQDVVEKAYSEHIVKLEGKQRELTILFSDIRGFTYMTETLGNDIINLLNIHYDSAIHSIHEENGIIGSIIGDALLAIYGAVDSGKNKSLEAIRSGWEITRVTATLRNIMIQRRTALEKERQLTEAEERVFKAVLIDVGVGIDGGTVFYGNIGSAERMTNTVIGDNVNSSSRLEGLTRVYGVPVIVSEYVKNEVESEKSPYQFIELDTVQVKGKTEGKKIFIPIDTTEKDSSLLIKKYRIFSEGLALYYSGAWKESAEKMTECDLEAAQIFLERMERGIPPKNWKGIWTMTSK